MFFILYIAIYLSRACHRLIHCSYVFDPPTQGINHLIPPILNTESYRLQGMPPKLLIFSHFLPLNGSSHIFPKHHFPSYIFIANPFCFTRRLRILFNLLRYPLSRVASLSQRRNKVFNKFLLFFPPPYSFYLAVFQLLAYIDSPFRRSYPNTYP